MNERIKEVKKTTFNGVDTFDYKGLNVEKVTWEFQDIPMNCDNISDYDMCLIAIGVYDTLLNKYGEEPMDYYLEYASGNFLDEYYTFEFLEEMDEFRWDIEEKLFLKFGGVYNI